MPCLWGSVPRSGLDSQTDPETVFRLVPSLVATNEFGSFGAGHSWVAFKLT